MDVKTTREMAHARWEEDWGAGWKHNATQSTSEREHSPTRRRGRRKDYSRHWARRKRMVAPHSPVSPSAPSPQPYFHSDRESMRRKLDAQLKRRYAGAAKAVESAEIRRDATANVGVQTELKAAPPFDSRSAELESVVREARVLNEETVPEVKHKLAGMRAQVERLRREVADGEREAERLREEEVRLRALRAATPEVEARPEPGPSPDRKLQATDPDVEYRHAVKIQTTARGRNGRRRAALARKQRDEKSAVRIQATARGRVGRKKAAERRHVTGRQQDSFLRLRAAEKRNEALLREIATLDACAQSFAPTRAGNPDALWQSTREANSGSDLSSLKLQLQHQLDDLDRFVGLQACMRWSLPDERRYRYTSEEVDYVEPPALVEEHPKLSGAIPEPAHPEPEPVSAIPQSKEETKERQPRRTLWRSKTSSHRIHHLHGHVDPFLDPWDQKRSGYYPRSIGDQRDKAGLVEGIL